MSNKRKREFIFENIDTATDGELKNALSNIKREQCNRKKLVEFVKCTKEELKNIDEPALVINEFSGDEDSESEDEVQKFGYFKGYNALNERQQTWVDAFKACCYRYGQPCNITTVIFINGEWFNETEKWEECSCEDCVDVEIITKGHFESDT